MGNGGGCERGSRINQKGIMNLFDMLLKNSKAKEVLFSSLFNYFFDWNETHGLRSSLFEYMINNTNQDNDDPQSNILKKVRTIGGGNFHTEFPLGKGIGTIDSLLTFGEGNSNDEEINFSFSIGLEIKIDDKSSDSINLDSSGNNLKDQLNRYITGLVNRSESFILIYLIPSTKSKKSIDYFSELVEKSQINEGNKLLLWFWRKPSQDEIQSLKVPAVNIISGSVENFIEKTLTEENSGLIDPISTEIRYVLKSFRKIIGDDFHRKNLSSPAKYPDEGKYFENIGEYRHTYQLLRNELKQKRYQSLGVSPNNTTIPVKFPPGESIGKPLFRIQTCRKYPSPLDNYDDIFANTLVLEFNQGEKTGEFTLEDVKEISRSIEDSVNEPFVGEHPGPHAEPVIILEFNSPNVEPENIKVFIDRCGKIFNKLD